MRRLLGGCTRLFRIFTLSLPRCLAAGRPATSAGTISRPCWCSPGNGATPRISRRRFRPRPGRCSGFSPNPLGMTTRWPDIYRSTWHRGWNIRRRCRCWTAATFPSRAGSRWEWPGSIAGGWVRWPTARQVCSWHTSARWGVRWWTSGFTCRRVGPRAKSGARRQECLYRGVGTGRSLS